MNWFLLLVILVMGGGGYYEYQTLHGQVTVDQMQLSDLKTKLQEVTDDEQKSAEAVTQLATSLADAKVKASDLQQQLQAAKASLAAAQPPAPAASSTVSSSTSPGTATGATTPPPVFTTKLGTISALDGKTYAACQLLKVNTDSIVVSNPDGITQIPLNVLPAQLQKMFGVDNKQSALSDDQVQALEQQRQAAAAAGK